MTEKLVTLEELARREDARKGVDRGLEDWDAGNDHNPIPPRGWLLGSIFCRQFVSSIIAAGAVGKTAVRIAQLLSLASGREIVGEHVFQRCRVLFVSLEDDADELRRRVSAARIHHGVTDDEVRGWFFLATPNGDMGKLMVNDENGRSMRSVLADRLEHTIIARNIDVVVLDPFIKSHSLEENSNTSMDSVMQLLTNLAEKYRIAVDIPHHVNKSLADPGNANRSRGASSMKDAARLVYTLNPMTSEEAQAFGISEAERRLLVRMDSAKVNIAPPLEQARWFRLVSVPLNNGTDKYPQGDSVQTAEIWTPPDVWEGLSHDLLNRILTDIDAGMEGGNRFSDAPNVTDRAAWRVVTKHAPDKTEKQAREIIKVWARNGVIIREDYENPTTRKTVKGLKVNGAKRPS